MPTPAWFQATDYFYNKLAQMQATDNAYTAQKLVDAFNQGGYGVQGMQPAQLAASAEGLFRHFNEYGNAENVSPNNYFDLATYKANKLAQVRTTGQTPPDGFQTWTEDALDAAMANAGLSYWDHYIQYGTMEGINPSASFITNDYLNDKLHQLNSLQPPQPLPDGSIGEWTRADLCEALRDANWNALEHYMLYNTSENIGYVPGPENPARNVNLTTGTDVLYDNGVPTNFIATVATTSSKSTLNSDDQITGSNGDDMLTVNMDRQWSGLGDKGFVKNVPVINLDNQTAKGDLLTFNANNIQGAETYNIDGNIGLSNLAQPGVTVNFSNVKTSENIGVGFESGAVKGDNDTLTIGMDNVQASGGITTNGIENIVINATGGASSAPLKYMAESTSLKVIGDADVSFGNVAPTITNVDLTEATGDNFVCTRRADEIESIKLGQGDDRTTVRNITPDAVLDGGDGNDRVDLYNTAGAYQFKMDNVETLNIRAGKNFDDQDVADPTASLILDGTYTTGLQNVKIGGGNGYALAGGLAPQARDIALVNYDIDELPIAVEGNNNVNLTVAGVTDIAINVGDGDNSKSDSLTGSVTLTDAENVAVNVTDNNKDSAFDASLNAGNATSLSLSNTQNSKLKLSGGDLSAASQVTVTGYGDVDISGANVGNEASAVNVNAQNLIGGTFTSEFEDNTYTSGTTHSASLNFTGSTTGKNNVTVDETYTNIKVNTGINDDILTLTAKAGADGKSNLTSKSLSGDLSYGTNTVNVGGTAADLVDANFSSLENVSIFNFTGLNNFSQLNGVKFAGDLDAAGFIAEGGQINLGPFEKVTFDGYTTKAISIADARMIMDVTGSNNGTVTGNGANTVEGTINTTGAVTISAAAGGLTADFAAAAATGKLYAAGASTLTLNGDSGVDDISGSIGAKGAAFTGNLVINASTGADVVDLDGVYASGNVTVKAGAGATTYDVTVGQATNVTLQSDSTAAGMTANVSGATGVISVTGTAQADTISVKAPAANMNVTIDAGSGDDSVTLDSFGTYTGSLTANGLSGGSNSLTFKGTNNLKDATLTTDATKITIDTGGDLTLAAASYDKEFAGVGTLKIADDLTAESGMKIGTAGLDIADGKTLTIGATLTNLGGAADKVDITGTGTLLVDASAKTDFNLTGVKSSTATINVILDTDQDTVVLGAATETIQMDAKSLAVTGFGGGDKISFGAGASWAAFDGGDFATMPATAGDTDGNGSYIIGKIDSGKIYDFSDANATASASGFVADHFASVSISAVAGSDNIKGKYYLDSGNLMVITHDDSNNSYLWYINDSNGNHALDSGDVTLVGTLTGTATLTAESFATAGA